MDQEQQKKQNRFIFSDSFYDQLGSEKEEHKSVFDISMQSNLDTKKADVNLEVKSSINNDLDNSNIISAKEIETPNFNFLQPKIDDNLYNENNLPTVNNINTGTDNLLEKNDTLPFNQVNSTTEENTSIPVALKEFKENFDVDSGINTALEQEIMKSRIENQIKIPVVENNSLLGQQEEKQIYRARRNAPTIPSWIQDEIKKQEETKKQEERLIVPQQKVEDTNFVPPVINIDEELIKDTNNEINNEFDYEENSNMPVIKSTLLDELRIKEQQTNKLSILAHYGDDFCSRDYVANPAIGRNEEIKQLILILLTPEKSGILVGKPGIGKTSIVEGLAYQLQRNNVPDALKGYTIVSVKTTSLLGTLPNGDTKLQILIDELKELDKIILFIDEIHMLMGATNESSLDFANMFKESLGRGSIKMIGATTNDEYERYVLRDKAFVRRFQRVDVLEPTKEQTVKILMGTLPKIEKNTGAKLNYSNYIQTEIMTFIVDITTEYKRVYGIGSRYPDICLTLLSQAFSQAVFDNRSEVNIIDIRRAIENSKNIYQDVIRKELVNFDIKFKQLIDEEKESN